jgi:leucine dehydrogenase
MGIFEKLDEYGHEEIVFVRDEDSGLRAIIAIHDTTLGPSLGGTRFWDYASEDDALFDVLRLSRGMTLKSAAAGLALGGGKAVIIGDPDTLKSPELFHAYGRFIDSLGGRYITAEDVNCCSADIACIQDVTPYVSGTPAISGNPSPFTARGVYRAMKAGALEKFGSDSLEGKTVVVQGLGSVGSVLCQYLFDEGAHLKVSDLKPEVVEHAVEKWGAIALEPDELLSTDCDIFAPCAMGAVLNRDNVADLTCSLICGAANNVLLDSQTADALAARDILYLPDFIVNAGGVINVAMEATEDHYDVEAVNAKVDAIYDTTQRIIADAKAKDISTNQAAEEYAQAVIDAKRD